MDRALSLTTEVHRSCISRSRQSNLRTFVRQFSHSQLSSLSLFLSHVATAVLKTKYWAVRLIVMHRDPCRLSKYLYLLSLVFVLVAVIAPLCSYP